METKQPKYDLQHAANIGRIVLTLTKHVVGDWGDCSINDPIVSIIDRRDSAHVLLEALANMSKKTAKGICAQLGRHAALEQLGSF